jgi:signal peptidase
VSKRRRAHREKTLFDYILISLSAVLMVSVAAIAALVIVVPFVVGGSALTVLTNSMAPNLPPGTLVVIRPATAGDIRVGDVITYQIESGKPAVISHRVVTRSVALSGEVTFITKGDNNAVADANPIRMVQVKGKLWYAIPLLGWVNSLVGGNGSARAVVAPIIAGLLFTYAAYAFVTWAIAARRRRRHRAQTAVKSDSPVS